jgi:hypothetical protein
MNFSQFLKLKGSAPSKIDEAAYELIAIELASNYIKQGLWTKSLSDANWNEAIAKALYVKIRHEQLLQEINKEINHRYLNDQVVNIKQEAKEYGLTDDDIDYLVKPIKAIKYLSKYNSTEKKVLDAIKTRQLTSVMCKGVLWVSDKPI